MKLTVDARFRRRDEVGIHIRHGKIIAFETSRHRVFLTHSEEYLRLWQCLAESISVDYAVIPLPCHLLCHAVGESEDIFVATAHICPEMEIATVSDGMSGVAARQQVDDHIVRTISLLCTPDSDVAHGALQHIVILQVGGNVYVSASANGERRFGNLQSVEVGIIEFGNQCGTNRIATHQRIENHGAVNHVIA